MRRGRSIALVVGLALPFAELGHAVAYWPHVPAAGAHFYFPAVLEASGTLVAALLLTALAVLGAARVLEGRRPHRAAWPLPLVFSGLLASQLTVFLIQEGLEAGSLPGLATLAAGLIGQQPVALLGALLLHWLSARLGPALAVLAAPRRGVTILRPVVGVGLLRSPRLPLEPGRRPSRTGRQRAPPAFLLTQPH
jgi:hypothetical protein